MTDADRDRVKDVVEKLCSIAMDNAETLEFLCAMDREHRTRQQGFGRLMVAWIRDNAGKFGSAGYVDLRNEATVSLCREIVRQVPLEAFLLPLI